jgi:hypothetical protein
MAPIGGVWQLALGGRLAPCDPIEQPADALGGREDGDAEDDGAVGAGFRYELESGHGNQAGGVT